MCGRNQLRTTIIICLLHMYVKEFYDGLFFFFFQTDRDMCGASRRAIFLQVELCRLSSTKWWGNCLNLSEQTQIEEWRSPVRLGKLVTGIGPCSDKQYRSQSNALNSTKKLCRTCEENPKRTPAQCQPDCRRTLLAELVPREALSSASKSALEECCLKWSHQPVCFMRLLDTKASWSQAPAGTVLLTLQAFLTNRITMKL